MFTQLYSRENRYVKWYGQYALFVVAETNIWEIYVVSAHHSGERVLIGLRIFQGCALLIMVFKIKKSAW